MDAYEATRIVFSRIQALDPDNAAKIMGLLLIQDHGEKEMIRLAFGPESLLHSVVLNTRKDLGLLPPSSTLLARHNSSSRLLGPASSPSSWAPPPPFSRSVASNGDDLHNPDDLASPGIPTGPSPFYNGDLIDELQLQDQLSFLNDPGSAHGLPIGSKPGGEPFYPDGVGDCRSPDGFPYGTGWGAGGPHHRRSCSLADLCLSSDSAGMGFGWKPCLYFARGYCKNGASCRFLHGLPDDVVAVGGRMDSMVEQQCQELLLRSKSQRLMASSAAAGFPFSPTGAIPLSPSSSGKCINFLLQQQQNESQRAAAAAAALMLGGEEAHKFMGRARLERSDFAGMVNPGSRQIYLTFPADSTFREEDVSNYFSIYGPVQDVRIPYQQKRMFGFVTFVYPETVKLILAKGNPHFVCDARVLVKPYKEKGKVPDKYRKQQQQGERGDFSACTTPTGLDSRDPYDLQQLGARMLYGGGNQDALVLRRKLEEQQQAAELQQAIELQSRRFIGLQLLDLKTRSHLTPPTTATALSDGRRSGSGSPEGSPPADKSSSPVPDSQQQQQQQQQASNSSHGFLHQTPSVNAAADKDEPAGEEDSCFQERAEHNLPDSPFASPTKSSSAGAAAAAHAFSMASDAVADCNNSTGGNSHLIAASALDNMASLKSCFFQMPRFSSGAHGAVGL